MPLANLLGYFYNLNKPTDDRASDPSALEKNIEPQGFAFF
jgi:hypothetical protein